MFVEYLLRLGWVESPRSFWSIDTIYENRISRESFIIDQLYLEST